MVRLLHLVVLALIAAPITTTDARDLSPTEEKIVAHVDAHNDEALALLERVCNINSGTMNVEGVREVGRVFARELEALGFAARWTDGSAVDRAGHLVAERPGSGLHLLLIGHLDTVFEPDSPFQKWEMVSGNEAHAPGAIDMKGGDVIIVYALRALLDAGVLDDLHVTVVMTGDEERVGRPIDTSRAPLYEAARQADIAIAFENGDNDPETAIIARRGATGWRLTVGGTPSHSMNLFKENIGAGAIYEASRILNSFYEDMSGEEFLTFNPGLILGGTSVDLDTMQARGDAFGKNNVIAESAAVTGDLRTLSIEQLRRAKKTMREIVAAGRPHTTARIVFSDGYLPMAPSDGNRRLFARLAEVSRDLGFGDMHPTDPGRAGAADIAFAALHVDMAIDGLGLLGKGDHTEHETADLRTLPVQTKRAAVLMYRLSRDPR
jgi:glutamate carboxypeptidase